MSANLGNTLNQYGPAILNCRGVRAARRLVASCGAGSRPGVAKRCRVASVIVSKHGAMLSGAAVEIREVLSGAGGAQSERRFETDVIPSDGPVQTYEDRATDPRSPLPHTYLTQVRHDAAARAAFVTGDRG